MFYFLESPIFKFWRKKLSIRLCLSQESHAVLQHLDKKKYNILFFHFGWKFGLIRHTNTKLFLTFYIYFFKFLTQFDLHSKKVFSTNTIECIWWILPMFFSLKLKIWRCEICIKKSLPSNAQRPDENVSVWGVMKLRIMSNMFITQITS